MKAFTAGEKEKTAIQIAKYLIKNHAWSNVRIFFNGKCLASDDISQYNEGWKAYPKKKFAITPAVEGDVFKNIKPSYYDEYANDNTLSIMFDGSPMMDDYYKYEEYINKRLEKYGMYMEQSYAWSASAYEM